VDIWGQALRQFARTRTHTHTHTHTHARVHIHTNTPRVRAVSGCPLVKEGDLFSGHWQGERNMSHAFFTGVKSSTESDILL